MVTSENKFVHSVTLVSVNKNNKIHKLIIVRKQSQELPIVSIRAKLPKRTAPMISGFCSMKRLEYFNTPLDRMLGHHRVTSSTKFAVYTPGWRKAL